MSWSCPFGQSMAPIMRSCTSRVSGAEIGWLGVRRSDVERHILQEAFLQHVVEMIGRVDEAGPHEQTGGVDDKGLAPGAAAGPSRAGSMAIIRPSRTRMSQAAGCCGSPPGSMTRLPVIRMSALASVTDFS